MVRAASCHGVPARHRSFVKATHGIFVASLWLPHLQVCVCSFLVRQFIQLVVPCFRAISRHRAHAPTNVI